MRDQSKPRYYNITLPDKNTTGRILEMVIGNRDKWEHSLTGNTDDESKLEIVNDLSTIADKIQDAGNDRIIYLTAAQYDALVDSIEEGVETGTAPSDITSYLKELQSII
jgi:hypothetical protein